MLPNKGLEWTSAVSVKRASARSPLNPVLGRHVRVEGCADLILEALMELSR